jgi:hypothetical protein
LKQGPAVIHLTEPIFEENDDDLDFFGIKEPLSSQGGFSSEQQQTHKAYRNTNASLKLEAKFTLSNFDYATRL